MALTEGAKVPVFYNGTYLEQLKSIELALETGVVRIETLEGLAGFSSGSGMVTFNVTSNVPSTGFEADFWNDANNEVLVTIQVGVGPQAYVGQGKIENVRVTRDTGAAIEGSFSWTGQRAGME